MFATEAEADEAFERMRVRHEQYRAWLRTQSVETHLLEKWHYAGIQCGIAAGSLVLCGYVQLPRSLRAVHKDYETLEVCAPGGLTYGIDGGGWVGFDTAHAGDCWDTAELLPLLPMERHDEAQSWAESCRRIGWSPLGRLWTVAGLRYAVEECAASVANLAASLGPLAWPGHYQLPAGTPTTRRAILQS